MAEATGHRVRTHSEVHRRREAAREAAEKARKRHGRTMLLRTLFIIIFTGLGVLEVIRPDLIAVALGAWAIIPPEV